MMGAAPRSAQSRSRAARRVGRARPIRAVWADRPERTRSALAERVPLPHLPPSRANAVLTTPLQQRLDSHRSPGRSGLQAGLAERVMTSRPG
jgi:hypothetical protein